MPASRSTTTKVARVGTRRSPRHAKPSKTVSSTTASSGAVARTTPTLITPPASATPASHSAPSRKKLLPSNYVPPRPRNAFLIFRGQVDLQAKTSGLPRSAISKIAGKLWRALSKAEQLDWDVLADEEKALHMTRFPGYVFMEQKRVKDELEWSAAKDDIFVIDEQGVIQYGPPSDEDVPVVAPRKGTRTGKKGARTGKKVAPAPADDLSASNEDAPAAEEYTWLYFPWEIEGLGYQNINGTMPYALMPPAPMDVALTGVYADDFLPQLPFGDVPIQSDQTLFNSDPAAMEYGNNPFQVPPFRPGGLLEYLFSDELNYDLSI